jgi:hypothetical protein
VGDGGQNWGEKVWRGGSRFKEAGKGLGVVVRGADQGAKTIV